ncbi:MAG: hypothetical protein WBQ18_04290 [Solirubrobacteraceae bacterium]
MLVTAVAFSDFILAVHILGVVIGFGVVFTFPLVLGRAAKTDPALIPWLLRIRQVLGRYLVNPGLLVVVVAGFGLASDEHRWGSFFVGWGILAALVIGAVEGAIVIPRSGRLAEIAERDLAATAVPGGGQRTSAAWSDDYQATAGLLSRATLLTQVLVVVTVFLMALHA